MENQNKLELVRAELIKIEQKEGVITPETVIKFAQDETNPLHNHFQWDDTEAAIGYRLWQARQLIKRFRITIKDKEVPEFINVKVHIENNGEVQGYVSSTKVIKQEDLLNQHLSFALVQLKKWKDEYEAYQQLSNIIDKKQFEKAWNQYH